MGEVRRNLAGLEGGLRYSRDRILVYSAEIEAMILLNPRSCV